MPDVVKAEPSPQKQVGRTIFRNTAALMAGSWMLKGINFVFNIVLARSLGSAQVGQYVTVTSFSGLFANFLELGVTQFAMREMARDRSKTQTLLGNLIAIRLTLAVVGVAGITLIARLIGYPPDTVLGIFLSACGYIMWAFLAAFVAVLSAHERLDYVSAATVVGRVVFIALGTAVLLSGQGFIALIIAGLLSIPIEIGVVVWAIRRYGLATRRFTIAPRLWLALIQGGIPFGMIALTLQVAYSIDSVMLSLFSTPSIVGWYGVAYGLILSLVSIFSGFKEAIVPSLSRVYAEAPGQIDQWYHRSVKVILVLGPAIVVGGLVIAYPLVEQLYSADFMPVALGIQILIWDVPLVLYTAFCGNITTIIGEERAAARIYGLNALANILLNLYAIPRFGLVGAALVTVITDFIGLLQFAFLLRRKLRLPNLLSVLVRAVAAALVMGGGVWLLAGAHFVVQALVGMAVYAVLVLALRLVDEAEWGLIMRLVRRLLRFLPAQ